jgi:hypothetical protein
LQIITGYYQELFATIKRIIPPMKKNTAKPMKPDCFEDANFRCPRRTTSMVIVTNGEQLLIAKDIVDGITSTAVK